MGMAVDYVECFCHWRYCMWRSVCCQVGVG
jgi:hypothetical protein